VVAEAPLLADAGITAAPAAGEDAEQKTALPGPQAKLTVQKIVQHASEGSGAQTIAVAARISSGDVPASATSIR